MHNTSRALLRVQASGDLPMLPVARACMPSTQDVLPYLDAIERSGWYSNFGPQVQALEGRLAQRFEGNVSVVSVSSATVGLTLALRALDLPEGGWCALPAWTFVATAHAVIQAGLRPWFIDVDPVTGMLDPLATRDILRQAPGPVVAIVPVCAYGAPLDVHLWAAFQTDTGVRVVIDAAAAHDTVVAAPVPVVVSLHATKVLGAGEGGYVASEDPSFCEVLRMRSSFGFNGSREAQVAGGNAKMSEYAAAVALAGMDLWDSTRLRYQQVAVKLRATLMDMPEVQFQDGWGTRWVTSVCVVRLDVDHVRTLIEGLHAQRIDTRQWWGDGCHRSPAFADVARTDMTHTDQLARISLGLPYSALMADEDIMRVAAGVRRCFQAS